MWHFSSKADEISLGRNSFFPDSYWETEHGLLFLLNLYMHVKTAVEYCNNSDVYFIKPWKRAQILLNSGKKVCKGLFFFFLYLFNNGQLDLMTILDVYILVLVICWQWFHPLRNNVWFEVIFRIWSEREHLGFRLPKTSWRFWYQIAKKCFRATFTFFCWRTITKQDPGKHKFLFVLDLNRTQNWQDQVLELQTLQNWSCLPKA